MQQVAGGVALISRKQEERLEWLSHWNDELQKFDFVGGPKRQDESFRDCAVRELVQSLGLRKDKDFIVSGGPRAHLDFTAESEATGEETQYVIEVFEAQLFGKTSRDTLDADPRTRWLTEEEIRARQTSDGQPVSELTAAVFAKTDLASEW